MAFIKIENFVINTAYIAAVKLDNLDFSGEEVVSVLIATNKDALFYQEPSFVQSDREQWLTFTGQAAKALSDYFSSFNNVTELTPHSHYQEISAV